MFKMDTLAGNWKAFRGSLL